MTAVRVFMFLLHVAVAAGAISLAVRLVAWIAG
jgi:hypothetical protein